MRSRSWIAAFLLFFSPVLAVAPAAVNHYEEGQRLFAAQDYAGALQEFQKAQELARGEPLIDSWIGACLNALGKFGEAEGHLKAAIASLQKNRRSVDLGYYSLLARIQANLHQFDTAIATLQGYTFKEDGSPKAAKLRQDLDKGKADLRDTIVSVGTECLHQKDLACARSAFAQAETFLPRDPPSLEAFAREALRQAAKAPAVTEEAKAARLSLYETAIGATRLWLETVPQEKSAEAKRNLATALLGTKRNEDSEEARQILTSLWEGAPEPKDVSIQLDLASIYLALEQWDLAASSAKTFIAHSPEGKKGPGYCKLSLALRNQGKCPEALAAGKQCTSTEGKPVELTFLKTCENMLAEEAARAEREATRRQDALKTSCLNLNNLAAWAKENAADIPIPEFVDALKDVAGKADQCAATGVKVLDLETLCTAGIGLMSNPANLSVLAADRKLDPYPPAFEQYSKLCNRYLDANQRASVESARSRVNNALGTPQ